MPLWDRLTQLLALNPQVEHERSLLLARPFDDFPDLNTQLANIRGQFTQPWRRASVSTALGVPAIFGAVSMVSNLVGSMSMKAFRNEVELPPDQRPRVIVRPDPFTIPREFYRATTWNLATRGEGCWWIAKRDGDGNAISVLNLPPQEVTITENPRNALRPLIAWRDRDIPFDDFRHLVYSREPGQFRGIGPLQMCGAAVSVAVESQEWAANFFAEGGNPSLLIKKAGMLSGELDDKGMSEADYFLTQWMDKPHNEPRLVDEGVESVTPLAYNEEGAQLLNARDYQNGEVARMFNIPGSLLDYYSTGSSLTYQNVGMEFEKLLRQCLRPNYLEVIEQTMSDLLTRSTVARFNTDTLTLADIKTRYDVYSVGIDAGIIDAEEARRFEGLAAGDVENAAVPFAAPQANVIPIQARSQEFRCDGVVAIRGVMRTCNAKLGDGPSFTGMCRRCKKSYAA
jgi:HK97 family phage portal protein